MDFVEYKNLDGSGIFTGVTTRIEKVKVEEDDHGRKISPRYAYKITQGGNEVIIEEHMLTTMRQMMFI